MARAKSAPTPAPARRSFAPDPRRLGALTLGALVLVGLPGIVLALNYPLSASPDHPATIHEWVARADAGILGLARGAHAWAAALVLALVGVHVARAYAAGRMDAPGRGATLAGLCALAILVGAYFTGTILPWDQQGWEALQHLRAGAGALGADIPSAEPADAPTRVLFFLHVFAVPAGLALVLALHLRRGSWRADLTRVARLVRAARVPLAVALVVVALLAALLPPALGPAPIEGLSATKPDWPFLWLVPIQDAFGAPGLLALPLVLALAAGALFVRTPGPKARVAITLAVAGAWIALTLLGAR